MSARFLFMASPLRHRDEMIVVRCTAKLLKRLRQPSKPAEPSPSTNPLGEWYADVDFLDREPFVVMLNAATGAGLVLPGRAADLRILHLHAGQQFSKLLTHFAFDPDQPRVREELSAWDSAPCYAKTQDRSLLGSLRQMKDTAWLHFVHHNRSLPEAAARQWNGLFTHPSLPRHPRIRSNAWRPIELVQTRLLPSATVTDLASRRSES
jgi:hypothetical protein